MGACGASRGRSPQSQLLTEGRQDGGLYVMGSIFQPLASTVHLPPGASSRILNYLSVQQMVLLQNGANI